jgi:hypothetical protein
MRFFNQSDDSSDAVDDASDILRRRASSGESGAPNPPELPPNPSRFPQLSDGSPSALNRIDANGNVVSIPWGFDVNSNEFSDFSNTLERAFLPNGNPLSFNNRRISFAIYMGGSSVSGVQYRSLQEYNEGRTNTLIPFRIGSDYDVAIVSELLFEEARGLGFPTRGGLNELRTAALGAGDMTELGIFNLPNNIQLGTYSFPVSYMIYQKFDRLNRTQTIMITSMSFEEP